ncbi:MAG: prepilin-type N-terminal cleavage/methylation domain-containing protein [Kiritimatiellae bacterium]|jgi:prepilin-type N-terminal cleavage/methylation domain-containing protein|nr:prepilin-type N-terminal cleavage/methylation domain-containing protein [Kiritimatiellia bacterium]
MNTSTPKYRGGFTLVEMLVVIAIIALLISIMLPVVSTMQERSKLVTCSNRLRSISQALFLYGTDHGGKLPSPSGPHEHPERRFAYFINPYLDSNWDNRYAIPPQYRCPMAKEYPWLNVHTVGFNYYLGGATIKAQGSGKTIMISDTRSSFYLFSNRWNSYFHYRHMDPTRQGVGKVSVVFGDGHWGTLPYGTPRIFTPHERCPALNPNRNF